MQVSPRENTREPIVVGREFQALARLGDGLLILVGVEVLASTGAVLLEHLLFFFGQRTEEGAAGEKGEG